MSFFETCAGCEHLRNKPAGKKNGIERKFFICVLGRSNGNLNWASRPVFEFAYADQRSPSVPIPAWCGLGKGKRYDA